MERFFINQKNAEAVVIGGVRLLKEFSPEQVVVSVAGGTVCVSGEKLFLAGFSENEIEVCGKIRDVVTEKRGER